MRHLTSGLARLTPKRVVFILSLLLTACFLAPSFLPAPAQAADTKMKHSAPDYFVPDQRIKIDAEVSDPAGVKLARCYFKAVGEADLVFVPMTLISKDTYSAILPAPSASTTQIDYLFLSVNNNNEVVKSQNFSVMKNAAKGIPDWQEVPKEGAILVGMELDKAPTELRGFSDNVTIDVVESSARFGVVAYLYYEATDSATKGAVAAASSSTGATSAGAITAGTMGWSTAAIVGVGVGAAAVAGGTAAVVSNNNDDDDDDEGHHHDDGNGEDLSERTILGAWSVSGSHTDGRTTEGDISFAENGSYSYYLSDSGEGTGTWTLDGTNLVLTFDKGAVYNGTASGDSDAFTMVSSNGWTLNFSR